MKKKFIFQILILVIIIMGYTKNLAIADKNNLTSDNKLILGSIKYVENINDISNRFGARAALSIIMADVDEREEELEDNSISNNTRLHKLISKLIFKIGYVDKQMHYFRNKLNRAPKTLDEMIAVNKKLKINKRWKLLSIRKSRYHIQGKNGEYNLKFISSDGFCEAVYNKYGILLNQNNDPINMGTYNYAAGMNFKGAHKKFDVIPYLKWGNSPHSYQKGMDNIKRSVRVAFMNYKKHDVEVYRYRQNLFRRQAGRVK